MKSKLTALHINIIGIVSALVIAAILFFAMIKPKNEDIEKTKTDFATTEGAGGTQSAVAQKTRELKDTQNAATKTKADWAVAETKYMDNPSAINFGPKDPVAATNQLPITYYNYMTTLPERFGRWVSAWYDSQRERGVSRMPGVEFPVDAFPANPNAISEIKFLRFPQQSAWPVQLECKTFDAAMEHLTKFNDMRKHGMPVVDHVALAGHSPNLTLSYDLTLYVIPKPVVPPANPRISASAPGAAGTAPGGGGAMGMMGGGSMGMMGGGSMGMMGGGSMGGMSGGSMGMSGGSMGGGSMGK